MSENWYELVETDDLAQGDIIEHCPVLVPRGDISDVSDIVDVELIDYDVIVLSQSCDFVEGQKDIPNLVMCTISTREQLQANASHLASKGWMDKMRKDEVELSSAESMPVGRLSERLYRREIQAGFHDASGVCKGSRPQRRNTGPATFAISRAFVSSFRSVCNACSASGRHQTIQVSSVKRVELSGLEMERKDGRRLRNGRRCGRTARHA